MKIFSTAVIAALGMAAGVFLPGATALEFESAGRVTYEEGTTFRVAIAGFDPTTYHQDGIPSVGNESINYVYNGQIYHFISLDNRDNFIADPEKYAAQYAGHCAFALAEPEPRMVEADPNAFAFDEGKLYLFENTEKLEMWKVNSRKFRILSDKRWEFEAKNIFGAKTTF